MTNSNSIQVLVPKRHHAYANFIQGQSRAMLYHSLPYMQLLEKSLQTPSHYLVSEDHQGHINGVLPVFLKQGPYGTVANSLPFYGSHGGVISRANDLGITCDLLNAFLALCKKEDCVASTIITTPFASESKLYETVLKPTHRDSRIGQLTQLPQIANRAEEAVMNDLDSKTRNMVRKAQKAEIRVSWDRWEGDMNFLAETHNKNMQDIGGVAKSFDFFKQLDAIFNSGSEMRLYTAKLNGEPVAALLLFYFQDTVEYFTPVIMKEFRTFQPMSLLIFSAMTDAVADGYRWWNWGGTWATQEGVHRFKKSWGATDMPYHYYTGIYDPSLLTRTRQELRDGYPNFYVVPFAALEETT